MMPEGPAAKTKPGARHRVQLIAHAHRSGLVRPPR